MWPLLTSEVIKSRRSAPVRLAVAAPLLLLVLELLSLFAQRQIAPTNPARLWNSLLTFGWIFWLGLFTPALIVFEAIALAGMEHSGRHWKQLFALPIPRWKIFAAKMLFCGSLVALSFLVFAMTSIGAVLLFSAVRGLALHHSI